MKNEEYKYLINAYFDGELGREKESMLFTFLSHNEECREYFKSMNEIKSAVHESIEEFPQELEERIYYSIQQSENKTFGSFFSNKFFVAASYTVAALLLVFSIMSFNESNNYKSKLDKTIEHINKQEQIIQLIMNSMPAPTVSAEQNNEVIVTSNL